MTPFYRGALPTGGGENGLRRFFRRRVGKREIGHHICQQLVQNVFPIQFAEHPALLMLLLHPFDLEKLKPGRWPLPTKTFLRSKPTWPTAAR